MKTSRDQLARVATLGLAIVVAWGCSPEQTPTGLETPASEMTAPESGTLIVEFQTTTPSQSLSMPQTLDALFLTFDSIRVFPVSGECDSTGPHGPGGPGNGGHGPHQGDSTFIEILTDPITLNVMELDDGLTAFLGEASLPEGSYSHLTLGISAVWGQTAENDSIPITVPGRSDPRLRIIAPFTIENGQAIGISIVIDLEQSIREVPPGSGRLVLRPVFWSEEHSGHQGGREPGRGPGSPGGRHGA